VHDKSTAAGVTVQKKTVTAASQNHVLMNGFSVSPMIKDDGLLLVGERHREASVNPAGVVTKPKTALEVASAMADGS